MSRYIDADALIQLGLQDGAYEYVSVQEIADFPTADVVEVVHGDWKTHKPLDEDGNIINGLGSIFRCSLCGEEVLFEPCNYCPNCGAKMDGAK